MHIQFVADWFMPYQRVSCTTKMQIHFSSFINRTMAKVLSMNAEHVNCLTSRITSNPAYVRYYQMYRPCHTNKSNSVASHVMSCHVLRCHDGNAPQRHAVGVSSNYRDSMMYITWHNSSVLKATQKFLRWKLWTNQVHRYDANTSCDDIFHHPWNLLQRHKHSHWTNARRPEDAECPWAALWYHWSPMVGHCKWPLHFRVPRVVDLHLLQSCIDMCPSLGTPTPEKMIKNGCLPCPP